MYNDILCEAIKAVKAVGAVQQEQEIWLKSLKQPNAFNCYLAIFKKGRLD